MIHRIGRSLRQKEINFCVSLDFIGGSKVALTVDTPDGGEGPNSLRAICLLAKINSIDRILCLLITMEKPCIEQFGQLIEFRMCSMCITLANFG